MHKIFMHCDLNVTVYSTSEYCGRDMMNWLWAYKSTTYTLSQVCNHWRQLLLLSPRSWSNIVASWSLNYRPDQRGAKETFSIIQRSLELSKRHPLRICMEFPERTLDLGPIGPSMVNAIKAESHRWKDMVFKIEIASQLLEIYRWKELQDFLPYLEHISLCAPRFDPTLGPPETPILSNVPRLKSVTLVHVDPRNFPQLPWKQLTSVSVEWENFQASPSRLTTECELITFVLDSATQLQNLSLGQLKLIAKDYVFELANEKPKTNKVNLIQSLEVGHPFMLQIMAGSSFRHLTHLTIWNFDLPFQEHLSSFLSTIPRCITSLSLVSVSPEIGTDAWDWLWGCLPHKLSFLTIKFDNQTFPGIGMLKFECLARYLHSSGVSKFHYDYHHHHGCPKEITGILLGYVVEMLETYVQLYQAQSNGSQNECYPNFHPCLKEFTFILDSLKDIGADVATRLQRVSSSCGMRIELRSWYSRIFLIWNELVSLRLSPS